MAHELNQVAQQPNAYLPPVSAEDAKIWLPYDQGGPMSPDLQETGYLPRAIVRPLVQHEIARSKMNDQEAAADAAARAAKVQKAAANYDQHLYERWQQHDDRGRRNANAFNSTAHAVDMPFTVEHQRSLQQMLTNETAHGRAAASRDLGGLAITLSTQSTRTEVVPTSPTSNGVAGLLRSIGKHRRSSTGRHRAA